MWVQVLHSCQFTMTVTCKRHKSWVIIYSCCPRHLSPKDADIQDSRSTQGNRPRIVPVETPALKHGTAHDTQPWKHFPKCSHGRASPQALSQSKSQHRIDGFLWYRLQRTVFGALSVQVSDCIKVITLCFWTATSNRTRRAASSSFSFSMWKRNFGSKLLSEGGF